MITFSKEDIKASYIVQEPGWFEYEVVDYKEKPAKTDGSPNYLWFLKGCTGEMEYVPVTYFASSKMKPDVMRIWKALNGGNDPEPGVVYKGEETIGIRVEGFTQRGEDQNHKTINEITDFRPVRR